MARTILGGEDPREVVLVDVDPPRQKTSPDFWATKLLLGVDSVCITELKKDGRQLYRMVDGKRVQVKRIYNRLVWDELQSSKIQPAFDWRDDLDLTWCSHPNWYWVWSKYSLPFLTHPTVPRTRLLADLEEIPADLGRYVLKPLFSYAGAGVVVDVTRADLDRVPEEQRQRLGAAGEDRRTPRSSPCPTGTASRPRSASCCSARPARTGSRPC